MNHIKIFISGNKYFLFSLTLVIIAVCNSAYSCKPENIPPIEIRVDISKTKPVSAIFQGFNIGNPFKSFSVEDKQYTDAVLAISPKTLRFPGGTMANFYHPDGKGHGLIKGEANGIKGNVGEHVVKLYSTEDTLTIKNNYLDDFISLNKKTNSEVLLVANILTGTVEELRKIINRLNDNKIVVCGVELGNELYLQAYKTKVPDVNAYIEMAKPFAEFLKTNFPKIKIGVNADPGEMLNPLKSSNWNKILSAESFYDAYILHVYAKHEKCDERNNLEDIFDCTSEDVTDFVYNRYPIAIEKLNKQFSDKSCWITEWNLHDPKIQGNTLLQAFYTADFLFSNIIHNSSLSYMAYHDLGGSYIPYSMISPTKSNLRSYSKNASYYIFQLLQPLCSGKFNIADIQIENNNVNLSGISFYDMNEKKIVCFLLNRTGSKIKLGNINIKKDSKNISYELENMNVLKGETLYSSPGKPAFATNNKYKELMVTQAIPNEFTLISNQKVLPDEIAAYSLTVLQLNINE